MNPDIHVAQILASLRKDYGGPPRVAAGLGPALSRLGVGVSYWAPVSSGQGELVKIEGDVRLFPPGRPHAWFRSPGLGRSLKKTLNKIDLFHVHEIWSYPQYIVWRLSRQSGIPYILRPAGELEPWRIRKKGFLKYLKKKFYLHLLGEKIMNQAACLQAITDREIPGFRASGYRGPITVIPNGIDIEDSWAFSQAEVNEGIHPDLKGKKIVLFLSRLNSEKGLDQLLPAWKSLQQQGEYDDFSLVIAGPDDRGYGSGIRALAEKIDLGTSVVFTGMVEGDQKKTLISRAECYILPSYSEGFSMSVLENLAAGKPVIITPGCNFPEVEKAGAGMVCEPAAESIARSLRMMLDLPADRRRKMGKKGRILVEKNFTWEVTARKMITVYRAMLENKPIPLHPEPVPVASTGK